MLSKAARLCAVAACAALVACGRIGVYPLPEIEPAELIDGELPPDTEPGPAVDAALSDATQIDASSDPDAAAPPTPALDAGGVHDSGAGLDARTDAAGSQDSAAALDATTDAAGSQDSAAALDATTDAAQDASGAADASSASDAAPEASLPACAGARVLALCWYLGALGNSCQQTCASHGGYDTRTAAAVGTPAQGGSLANCSQVLNALGHTGQVASGMRPDGMPLGCHVWAPDGWWIQNGTNFNANISAAPARISCACLQ
jgi:hypothetical protein